MTNRRAAGMTALAGAGVVLVGAVLPWASVSTIFGTLSKTGIDGDGGITLILSLVVAGIVAGALWGGPARVWPILGAIGGSAINLVAFVDLGTLGRGVDPAVGLFVTLLGGTAIIAGCSVMAGETPRPEPLAVPPAIPVTV